MFVAGEQNKLFTFFEKLETEESVVSCKKLPVKGRVSVLSGGKLLRVESQRSSRAYKILLKNRFDVRRTRGIHREVNLGWSTWVQKGWKIRENRLGGGESLVRFQSPGESWNLHFQCFSQWSKNPCSSLDKSPVEVEDINKQVEGKQKWCQNASGEEDIPCWTLYQDIQPLV